MTLETDSCCVPLTTECMTQTCLQSNRGHSSSTRSKGTHASRSTSVGTTSLTLQTHPTKKLCSGVGMSSAGSGGEVETCLHFHTGHRPYPRLTETRSLSPPNCGTDPMRSARHLAVFRNILAKITGCSAPVRKKAITARSTFSSSIRSKHEPQQAVLFMVHDADLALDRCLASGLRVAASFG